MSFKAILVSTVAISAASLASARELHSGDYGFIAGAVTGAIIAAPAGPQAQGQAALAGGTAGSIAFTAGKPVVEAAKKAHTSIKKRIRKLRR